jgi:hypothetical protein
VNWCRSIDKYFLKAETVGTYAFIGYFGLGWVGDENFAHFLGMLLGGQIESIISLENARQIMMKPLFLNTYNSPSEVQQRNYRRELFNALWFHYHNNNLGYTMNILERSFDVIWHLYPNAERRLFYQSLPNYRNIPKVERYYQLAKYPYQKYRLMYCASVISEEYYKITRQEGVLLDSEPWSRDDFIKARIKYTTPPKFRITTSKKLAGDGLYNKVASYMREFYNLKTLPVWAFRLWYEWIDDIHFNYDLSHLCASDILYCLCTIQSMMGKKDLHLIIEDL